MSLDRKTIISNLTSQFKAALNEAKNRNNIKSEGKESPLFNYEVDFMYAIIEIESNSDHVASKNIDIVNNIIDELGKYKLPS